MTLRAIVCISSELQTQFFRFCFRATKGLKKILRLSVQTVFLLSDGHRLVKHGILEDVTLKHTALEVKLLT